MDQRGQRYQPRPPRAGARPRLRAHAGRNPQRQDGHQHDQGSAWERSRIDDVIVDPGYSLAKVETFLLPVRREGVHISFRPASHQWKPKPFNDDAITIGGQLFYAGVPEKMLVLPMPPMGSTIEDRRRYEERFNERANNYRYRLHAGPDSDGTTRRQNPFEAGSLRSEGLPRTMRNRRRGPLVELVNGKPPAATVSVSAGDLPLQQRCIAGTTAHAISMAAATRSRE